MNSKKYILKPGKHQFAPGSPAIHDNDNLSDEEARWYIEKYPHIESLFIPLTKTKKDNRKENIAAEPGEQTNFPAQETNL